jgi:hypothetical protein
MGGGCSSQRSIDVTDENSKITLKKQAVEAAGKENKNSSVAKSTEKAKPSDQKKKYGKMLSRAIEEDFEESVDLDKENRA